MSYFYPQAIVALTIRWEDFDNKNDPLLQGSHPIFMLAKRIRVAINDYTKADTFEAEVDYKNFPFDPRTIRSIQVSIYMEDRTQIFKRDNRLDSIEASEENVIFTGFVDEGSIQLDDTRRVVRLEGRDQTSLLIDAPYNGKAIDPTLRLDKGIQQIIDTLPAITEGNMEIDVRVPGGAEALPSIAKFSPDFTALGRARSGKKKEYVWDVIKDLVARSALICFVELNKLVITQPRTLYSQDNPVAFLYGKNLKSLKFKRKIGRQKGINIVVRSFNVEKKDLIEAKIPEEAQASWANSIGVSAERQTVQEVDTAGEVKTKDAPFISFNVKNVISKEQLVQIGQGIYEEVGRQQIEGNMVSKDMCVRQKTQGQLTYTEFNLLKLRNGTAVRIEIAQDDLDQISRLSSENDRAEYLKGRCFSPDVAQALARSHGKFETRFYTKAVEYTMDQDQGFQIDLNFINFIELDNKALR